MSFPEARFHSARDAGPFRILRIDYPPGLRQPMHHHDFSGLTLVLSGQIRESTRAGEVTGSALSVVVKPAGIDHADEVGPNGARTLQISFEADVADELADEAVLDVWRWLHGPSAVPSLTALARALERAVSTPEELEERVIEAVGCLPPREADGSDGAPDWLLRVKEALDDELESGVTVRELAGRVGAHPISVSRAFRRHYGRTISDYRKRERVRRAAARITDSRQGLSHIAFRTGYADHPHLCRDFLRFTGVTPSGYRRLAG